MFEVNFLKIEYFNGANSLVCLLNKGPVKLDMFNKNRGQMKFSGTERRQYLNTM